MNRTFKTNHQAGQLLRQTRRQLYRDCGVGVGKIALASLLAQSTRHRAMADTTDVTDVHPRSTRLKSARFSPRAKRVIFLFMAGAPSQLELFDYKPALRRLEGQPIPPSVIGDQRYAFIQPDAAVLPPQFRFARHGQSGAEISEMLPHLAGVADDLTFIRSTHTDQFNHAPAQLLVNTGNGVPGRPSMGSWLSYGLGSEADDLPAFVVLKSGGNLSGGSAMWNSGFLPSSHQGVAFRDRGDPILNVANPAGLDPRAQRDTLDLIGRLNRHRFDAIGDPEIATRIDAYEMAYRMQSRAPELMALSDESTATLNDYGVDPTDAKGSFAKNCLLARRMVQRGVRFVQVYHAGWDHHSDVRGGVERQCRQIDQPAAALVRDLKRRGMLDETLVVWAGEFGRTPMVESSAALGRSGGRDHHPQAFTVWMAGGGVRAGMTYGATDELGFNIAEHPVHVHDLQATILHLMGIDHTRLTFRHRGLDFRLTGVEPHRVIDEVIA